MTVDTRTFEGLEVAVRWIEGRGATVRMAGPFGILYEGVEGPFLALPGNRLVSPERGVVRHGGAVQCR